MPLINVPGVGAINFPSTMSNEQIVEAIERDILPGRAGATRQAPAANQMEPVPERGFFGTIGARAGDVAGSLASGAGSVATGVGGIGGLLGITGYDNVLSRLGSRASEFGSELMSPELRNQRRVLANAMKEAEERGFAAEAGAALTTLATNPGLLASMAVEQIPAFILSGGAGRAASLAGQVASRGGARAGVAAVDRAGQVGAIGTAAGLQTGGIADETYREVMGLPAETINNSPNYQRLLETMSPDEARQAIANRAAREAAALGGTVSVAAMTALPGAERALFTRGVSQSAVRRALGVGASEAFSEAGEEGGGKAAQNLGIQRQADPDRDLLRGVGGAAATGAVLGGAMGAGVGALQRPPAAPPPSERSDLRGAIEDIVSGRGPVGEDTTLPGAQRILPREQRSIQTDLGDLTPSQFQNYMNRRLPELMATNPELASRLEYARNEAERGEVFRDFISQEQAAKRAEFAQGRQQADEAAVPGVRFPMPPVREAASEQPPAQPDLPVQPEAEAPAARTPVVQPVEPAAQEGAPRTPQAETFNIPIGRQFSVSTPDGSMSVDVVPEVVDLFSLTPASGGLQNRMIDNAANQATISNIANAPDFTRLGTSPYSDRGAPIVGPDNIIEVGNHRVEGLKRGAENNPEAFQSYVRDLNEAGYDTSGMRFPVLVRRRVGELSPEQRQDFTRLSNTEANQGLSDLEMARQDASRLTPELLARFDGEVTGGIRAAKNLPFVRDFMAQITTPSERNRLVTPEGGVSDAFANRLEKALFASAYNDIGLIKRAVESGDDDSKSITGGMIEATGAMQELRRGIESGRIRPEFGIVDALVKAADRIRAGKANGLTPADILATEDMLNPVPPLERELIKLFSNDNLNKIASKSAIGKRLKAFVEEAKTQTTDADLVGGERRVTPEEAAVTARNPGQASMFSARRAGAAEGQAAPEPEETAPNQDTARQTVNKYLGELRAMGRQGRLIANSLEGLLKDGKLNANQIYQAFMVGETLAKTLPAKADYRVRFLQDIIVDNEQAGTASGAKVGERAQGRVIYPTESLPGFIELSLAEDMLPLLRETAAHEAFHVLQSYFSNYDANFADRINKFFKDGMKVSDLEPSIKRRLQGLRVPGQKTSYYDALVQGLGDAPLSAKEAQAYAFGALIDAANRGQKVTALIPSFQRFVAFARDFLSRMKRGLTGSGFTAPADILTQAQQRGAAMGQAAPVVAGAAYSGRKPFNSKYAAQSKDLGGPIIYQDPYVALIEATDGRGEPMYVAVTSDGTRTRVDIQDYTGTLFTKEELNVLLRERAKRIKENELAASQNPDGPFSRGNVAFDDNFPQNLRGFAQGIVRELGISNEKIFFTTFNGALEPYFVERNKLQGEYYAIKAMGFAPRKYPRLYGLAKNRLDGKYRAIAINDSHRPSVQIETLAHEIGHVFDKSILKNASNETQREIEQAFDTWMLKNGRKGGKEYIRLLRTPMVGKRMERRIPEGMSATQFSSYERGFDEWFADQVARWSLTSEPAKTLIGRFFQRIAAAYRKIVDAMGAAGLPNQTVAKFIEEHRGRTNIPVPTPPSIKTKKKPVQMGFDFSARRITPIAPTISVDGVDRPTINNEGKPIHPTEDGVRNFWRWFGDSKVVDDDGLPVVLYHGTSKDVDFSAFKMKDRGIWFADSPKEASSYATDNESMGSSINYSTGKREAKNVASRVIPAYLSIKNPKTLTQEESDKLRLSANYAKAQAEMFRKAVSDGYDGIDMGGGIWVALKSPAQIKSSIGNKGLFSPAESKIQFSARRVPSEYAARSNGNMAGLPQFGQRVPGSTPAAVNAADLGVQYDVASRYVGKKLGRFVAPEKVERFFTKMQDSMLPVGRMIDDIKASGGSVPVAMDAYLKEDLLQGKVADMLDKRGKSLYTPVVEAVSKSGLTMQDFENYLYARHATERNAYIASINPKLPDGGSGLTNAEAKAMMAEFQRDGKTAKLNSLASMFDKIIADTNRLRVESGLTPDFSVIKTAEDGRPLPNYKNYAPLRGFADESADADEGVKDFRPKTGKMLGARGREDRRMTGRERMAGDILAHAIMQNTQAVIRSEQNKVGQSFLAMVRANPTQTRDIAEVVNSAPLKTTIVDGVVKTVPDMFYKNSPDILVVKEGGKEIAIRIKDEGVARSMTGASALSPASKNILLQGMATLNRTLAKINTAYNPEFLITNFARDLQTFGVNVQQYDVDGIAKDSLRDLKGALSGVRDSVRGTDNNPEMKRAFERFRALGGTTEMYGFGGLESRVAEINKIMAEAGGQAKSWKDMAKTVMPVIKFIEDYNTIVENGIRTSLFKNLTDRGINEERAAQIAKNVTVNFTKGGENKVLMNSLYLFYNASLQGTMAMVNALGRSPKVRKIVAGIVVAGVLQDVMNSMLSGMDDDDEKVYDKIPDHILKRSFIMMDPFKITERGYFSFPMPYGFNAFFNMGREMSKAGRGQSSPGKAAGNIIGTFVDAFNPIGGSENFYNFMAPTFADPIIDVARNRDFTDRPIVPERGGFGVQLPESQKYWNNTFAPYVSVSNFVNSLTGGTPIIPGAVDISPNMIQYVVNFATGGVGKFAERSFNTVTSTIPDMLRGDLAELDVKGVPFARSLYGSVTSREDMSVYMDRMEEVLRVRKEISDASQSGQPERVNAAIERYPGQVQIMETFNRLSRDRAKISQSINEISRNQNIPDESKREILKSLRDQQNSLVRLANRLYVQNVESR